MILTCPSCETRYNLPDDKISAKGTKVRCTRCKHVFKAYPQGSPDLEEPKLEDLQPQAAPQPSATDNDLLGEAPDGTADDFDDGLEGDGLDGGLDDDLGGGLGGDFDDGLGGDDQDDGLDDGLGDDGGLDDDFGAAAADEEEDLLGQGPDLDQEDDGLDQPSEPDDALGDLLGELEGGDDAAPQEDSDDGLDDGLGGGLDSDLGGDLDDMLGGLEDSGPDLGQEPDQELEPDLDDDLGGGLDDGLDGGLDGDLGGGLDEPGAPAAQSTPEGESGEGGDTDFESLLGDLGGDEAPADQPGAPGMDDEDDDLLGGALGDDDGLSDDDLSMDAPAAGALGDEDEDEGLDGMLDGMGDAEDAQGGGGLQGPDEDDDLDLGLADTGGDIGAALGGGAAVPQEGEDDDSLADMLQKSSGSLNLDDQPAKEKAPRNKLPFIIAGGVLLVLVGVTAAMFTVPGLMPDFIKEMLEPGDEAQEAEGLTGQEQVELISLTNVRQFAVLENEKAGKMLVVEGRAVNNFPTPKEMIRVRVSLQDAQGQTLESQIVTCGNTLSLFQLQIMGKTEIEASLSSELGILSSNVGLKQGQGVPFNAVFFEPPATVAKYNVEVVSATDSK